METTPLIESQEKKIGKQLYAYQQGAIEEIFTHLKEHPDHYSLLYQLPTGGGKTVIFSEIARRYIESTGKKVLILTHRIELCRQTSAMLEEFQVRNKVINSHVKELEEPNEYQCFVAMVETLNNRLADEDIQLENIGLTIIDEAHNNSFRKLFSFFSKGIILGVTATPLSSNILHPMKNDYRQLIVGESISSLVKMGFLAKATTYSYYVTLTSLKVGINGDYTVSSSEALYNQYLMQDKLLTAYEEKSKGKKTLIFNNGIQTSKQVYATFKEAGYDVRHLDNTNSAEERRNILEWFRAKPDAILTSVSILTTGFDEPTVESIILNRATRSLTLYLQMIGRGSRILPDKSGFTVIDLGNNLSRFGLWESAIDWMSIFHTPELYLEGLKSDEELERAYEYVLPEEIRNRFSQSFSIDFDIAATYKKNLSEGLKPQTVIEQSIAQHIHCCIENAGDADEALALADLLNDEIDFRVKRYSYCLSKSTSNYVRWLQDEYKRKLRNAIVKKFNE